MATWRMRIARWITQANTHSQSVILTAVPLQQWLQERGLLLRHTALPVLLNIVLLRVRLLRTVHSVMLVSLLPHTFLWSRLSHSIEQRPSSELNIRCDNQENPLCFYCPAALYCIPNSPPLACFLNQTNPFHILSPYYFKIHFNNILLSTFCPSRRVFRFRFVGPKFYVDLRSLWCTPHPIPSYPTPSPLIAYSQGIENAKVVWPLVALDMKCHQSAWKSFSCFERHW